MPRLHVTGHGELDVDHGKRLVLAIEDAGVDILHRCGGFARCTTCRVVFESGEPERMTQAEREKLEQQGNLGTFRLSCQCEVTHDMTVEPLMRVSTTEMDDPGPRPADEITPDPEWLVGGQGSW